jgi:hypothetical protein
MEVLGGGRLGQVRSVIVGLVLRFTLQNDLGGRHSFLARQPIIFQDLGHEFGQALAQVLGNLPPLANCLQK